MRITSLARTMAYDEQRTFGTRPLQNDMHVEHDGRRMYGRGQSIGFQYTHVSPPPTRGYAPAGIHMAGPSRRPLPTPRTRPESMPPPPRQHPLVVQAPAPSRPAILAPSATLAVSPTAPPSRRPLPTPALPAARPPKHGSIDLTARPPSPVKSSVNAYPDRDLRIPSSFSRRTAPLPDVSQRPLPPPAVPLSTPPPTWPRASRSDTHEMQQSNSAPLWNRNLPATSSAPIGANVIERRSTVSGVFPPAVLPTAVPPLRPDRRAESPERAQPAQRPQFSPSRRPLPSSPTEPPHVLSIHQRVPASSEDEREPSSPSDTSSLSDRDPYQPMTFADPMQVEEDEHEIMFARNAHTPSPQYGIRDLPSRSRIAIANRDDSQNANVAASDTQHEQTTRSHPVRSATLPQPPASSSTTPQGQPQTTGLPQSPRARMSPPVPSSFTPFPDRSPGTPSGEHQSLTLRFASMGLAEERERERERQTQQEVPSPTPAQSPVRATPGPTSPVRQQPGWPANVPPLPRTPGNTRRFFGTTDVPSEFALPNISIHDISRVPCSPSSAEPASQAKRDIFAISTIVTNEPNTPGALLFVISESQLRV